MTTFVTEILEIGLQGLYTYVCTSLCKGKEISLPFVIWPTCPSIFRLYYALAYLYRVNLTIIHCRLIRGWQVGGRRRLVREGILGLRLRWRRL
jgi:hypothetical protein